MKRIIIEKKTLSTLLSLIPKDSFQDFFQKAERNSEIEKEEKELVSELYQISRLTDWETFAPKKESLVDIILKRLSELNMKDPELYNGIGMLKSKWQWFVNGTTKTFNNKNIIWQIVFFLDIDEYTAMHMFHLNGNAIPPNFDDIDLFLFQEIHKGNYNIDNINEALKNYETYKDSKLTLYSRKPKKAPITFAENKSEQNKNTSVDNEFTVSEEMLRGILSLIDDARLVEIKSLISNKDIEVLQQIKTAEKADYYEKKKPQTVNIKDFIHQQMETQGMTKKELFDLLGGKDSNRNLNNLLKEKSSTKNIENKNDLWRLIIVLKMNEGQAMRLFHLNKMAIPPNCDHRDVVLFRAIQEKVYDKKEINKRLVEEAKKRKASSKNKYSNNIDIFDLLFESYYEDSWFE